MYKDSNGASASGWSGELQLDPSRPYVLPSLKFMGRPPPEDPESSLENAIQTIECMKTHREGDIEVMFSYDSVLHEDPALTLKRIDRALQNVQGAVDRLLECGGFLFISWMVHVFSDVGMILDAIACVKVILRSVEGEEAYMLFQDLQMMVMSENEEVASSSLAVLMNVFSEREDWRPGVLGNGELMAYVLGCVSLEKEEKLGLVFEFLATVFISDGVAAEYAVSVTEAAVDICRYGRSWLENCLGVIYQACLNDVTFRVAMERGLERRVLELMPRIPMDCARVFYQIICQILEVQKSVQCESQLTTDASFFEGTAELLRRIGSGSRLATAGETINQILMAIDILAETFGERLFRFGVISACCDLVGSLEMRNAKAVCLTVAKVIESGDSDVRKRTVNVDLITAMTRMLDYEDGEIRRLMADVLIGLHEVDPEHFASMYIKAGLPLILTDLCDAEDEEIAQIAEHCLQVFGSTQ
jgi:hypothetical protein